MMPAGTALAFLACPRTPGVGSVMGRTLALAPGTPPATKPVPAVTAPAPVIAAPDAFRSLAMVDPERAQILLDPIPGRGRTSASCRPRGHDTGHHRPLVQQEA